MKQLCLLNVKWLHNSSLFDTISSAIHLEKNIVCDTFGLNKLLVIEKNNQHFYTSTLFDLQIYQDSCVFAGWLGRLDSNHLYTGHKVMTPPGLMLSFDCVK